MSIYSIVFLWLMIAYLVLAALGNISQIGKERKPVTPEFAVGTTIVAALWIFGLATVLVKG